MARAIWATTVAVLMLAPAFAAAQGVASAPSDNPEMTRIYNADQAVRQGDVYHEDWTAITRADSERRERVRSLLARGELHSAADFLHATFIFQHGGSPDDCLLAHTLAIIALKEGSPEGAEMAAKTLDRYLQVIGRSQIYGTQLKIQPGVSISQEPYDRTLISDALLRLLGVPDQKGQQDRRAVEAEKAQVRQR